MKSFFDAGVHVASSSDFPVTPEPDPLMGMQIGVMRWYPESSMGGTIPDSDVLWPAERVTIQQMIRSFTINGANANFLEKQTGSIKVGKSADLVVAEGNLLDVRPEGDRRRQQGAAHAVPRQGRVQQLRPEVRRAG